MASSFTSRIDRSAELRMLARYSEADLRRVLQKAADAGGQAGAMVMASRTPIGTAQRLSQFYRQHSLRHGALRGSVRSAPIRMRGPGVVIGPMGLAGFARRFRGGAESVASAAFAVARMASERVLEAYVRG